MDQQTVQSIQPILALLQQPAFCIHTDGRLLCNQLALPLAPADAEQLDDWLADAAALWHSWDRSGTLELPLTLADCAYTVTASPLQDGTLFLLTDCTTSDQAEAALSKVSKAMRQPLTSLSLLLQLMTRHLEQEENEARLSEMAGITRQLYRLFRLTGNLSDLELLNDRQYPVNLRPLSFHAWLSGTMEEAQSLCASLHRPLSCTLASKDCRILGDPALLDRMFYNLLSNAIKFGAPETPILCRTERTGTHMLFRIRNTCANGSQELLQTAFTRLDQREVIPTPQSGMGLGLPLVLAIARFHGGMAAVEALEQTATVTVSIPLAPAGSPLPLRTTAFEYSGGMRRSMLELSDSLPNDLFHPDAL